MSEHLNSIFSTWGIADADERMAALERAISDAFYYQDPNTPEPITSKEAYNAMLQAFSDNMPGGSAKVATSDGHHNHHRAIVDFMKDGQPMMRGQYYAETDDAGRITRLVGFIGTGDG